MEGKTIKQIADELGVSKQAVQKRMSREPLYTKIQPYIATVAGMKYIADIGEKLIKATFLPEEPATASIPTGIDKNDPVYTLMSILQTELESNRAELATKNQQIAELNARLADTTAALMTAQQTAQAAQALHAGTLRKQLTTGRKPPLWARLFPSRFSNDERNLDQ